MIYLDNNATTKCDPAVLKKMQDIMDQEVGNPSSVHRYGQRAKNLKLEATSSVAHFFGVKESELIFTSGATEALNMLIQGFSKRGHLITSTLEHVAVLQSVKKLEKQGWRVSYLTPPPLEGAITCEQVESALCEETVLIILMAANNETGVKTEIEAIGQLAARKGIYFLVDGVALLGKESFSIPPGVSSVVFSGHKIHAPPGIGLAIVKKGFPFEALIVGGMQEQGRRGGTENLPGIVAFATALELIQKTLPQVAVEMRKLRDYFEREILQMFPDAFIYGYREKRISNTSSICFPHLDGETMLISLDLKGVAVSAGSACSSGGLEPSHVLLNMGMSPAHARSSLRFSLSRYTTRREIDSLLEIMDCFR